MLIKIINTLLSPEMINKSLVNKFCKSTQPNQTKTFTVKCIINLFKISFHQLICTASLKFKLKDDLSLIMIEKQEASLWGILQFL